MWYIYPTGHSSATRKDEILPFAATWIDLENIMLSTISQTGKAKNPVISPYVGHKTETHRHRLQYGGYQREAVQINGDGR